MHGGCIFRTVVVLVGIYAFNNLTASTNGNSAKEKNGLKI